MIEREIWETCAFFVRNPGKYLAEAQQQLRERTKQSVGVDEQLADLRVKIAVKQTEQERVLTLARKGLVTMGQAEVELDTINQETARLRTELDSIASHQQLLAASERHLTETATALQLFQSEIDAIEAMSDGPAKDARKRPVVEALVLGITAHTDDHRHLTVLVKYAHQPEAVGCETLGLSQHDLYHSGEINHLRSLQQGTDRWAWEGG